MQRGDDVAWFSASAFLCPLSSPRHLLPASVLNHLFHLYRHPFAADLQPTSHSTFSRWMKATKNSPDIDKVTVSPRPKIGTLSSPVGSHVYWLIERVEQILPLSRPQRTNGKQDYTKQKWHSHEFTIMTQFTAHSSMPLFVTQRSLYWQFIAVTSFVITTGHSEGGNVGRTDNEKLGHFNPRGTTYIFRDIPSSMDCPGKSVQIVTLPQSTLWPTAGL